MLMKFFSKETYLTYSSM